MTSSGVQQSGEASVRTLVPGSARTRFAFSGRRTGNVSLLVGDGDVPAARRELMAAVGTTVDAGVFMQQVHGAGVAVVGPSDRGRGATDHDDVVPGVDAVVTTAADVALVVMVADCVPVLLAVPDRGIAAVHAGRRGVESGVVGAAVATLAQEARVEPSGVVALLGPAIGGCCYEVPAELALQVSAIVPGVFTRTRWGTTGLDLPAAVTAQLGAAGVGELVGSPACTQCDAEEWFSHRATTNDGQPAGRQAGVIRIASPAMAEPRLSLHSSP